MKDLKQYLNESFVTEFKQDMRPQIIVIMGKPAAGKTTFMTGTGLNRLLKRPVQARQLDSDNNLKVEQRNSCQELAMDILVSCNSWSTGDGTVRQKFRDLIDRTQAKMDELSDKGGSPRTDLDKIDWGFCKGWVSRYEKAAEDQKDKVITEFQKAFEKEYFESVFSNDYSRRSISKQQYKKDFQAKLRGIRDISGTEFVSPTDVAIAITGDDIEKIDAIVEIANEMGSSLSVVYLDCTIERSIRNDIERGKKGGRTVGEKIIREKAEGIDKTWKQLESTYKEHGIFRMWHMVEGPRSTEKNADYVIGEEFVNPKAL
jgi:predicted kinase